MVDFNIKNIATMNYQCTRQSVWKKWLNYLKAFKKHLTSQKLTEMNFKFFSITNSPIWSKADERHTCVKSI